LFSATSDDSAHVFEAALSPPAGLTKEWRLDPTPKRLTFGTCLDDRPSLASAAVSGTGARRLAFASLARNENIWSIDLDTSRPPTGGKLQRLTQETGFQIFPSVSRDGAKLVFISHAANNDDIWLLDLKTGKRLLLSTKASRKLGLILHPDGSRVTYWDVGDGASYAISASGGAPEKLYKGTWFWDWSADHTRILHFESGKSVAMVLNLQTGKSGIFQDSRAHAGVFRLSPDNRWILFRSRYQLFVTPFSGDQAGGEAAWIPITDGSTIEERGDWSSDGNWIYSLSFRDGFECIWAYPIDPQSRRPAGKPVDVCHSHGSRLSLRNANQVSLRFTVARDKVVFQPRRDHRQHLADELDGKIAGGREALLSVACRAPQPGEYIRSCRDHSQVGWGGFAPKPPLVFTMRGRHASCVLRRTTKFAFNGELRSSVKCARWNACARSEFLPTLARIDPAAHLHDQILYGNFDG
jgi:hypothetical protein